MKHDDVFEVLEPPPHGLTRLRARLEERRATRLAWPALLAVATLAVLVVLWPRSATPEVDLQTPGLSEHLWQTTMDKLAVDQPKYASYKRELGNK